MTKVRVNERGLRIGESHPNAKLKDSEIDQLLADRERGLSLAMLATKYGLSKSGVKAIVDGRNRGQIGPTVARGPARAHPVKKVRVKLSIPLHYRARLHRLGGSRWVIQKIEEELQRAR